MTRVILLFIAGAALLALGIVIGWQLPPSALPGVTSPEPTGLQPTYRSGPFRVSITVKPAAPQVGENRLQVVLEDSNGNSVSGAQIHAVAEMPAMGAMPAMQAPAEMQEVKPGLYQGTFDLSMEGSWPLMLAISKPEIGETRITFDMATGRTGLQLASGGAPLAADAGPSAPSSSGGKAMQEAAPPGTVALDARRRQLIGVETAEAKVVELVRPIRAVGQVTYDERRLTDVSLKFNVWIGELYVDYIGAPVKKNQPLFTVYGPELLAAQQEYLELNRRAGRSDVTQTLLAAARKRLSLWDITPSEIAALERRGTPNDYVTIHAPQSGTVVMKNVVEGTAQPAGATLMRIADLSRVWVEAEVYEAELPLVQEGMKAKIHLPYLPDQRFEGVVDYVYPYLENQSRTGRLQITLANPNGVLKPEMYAEVKLKADLGQRLTVPEEAVIIAGETRVIFEDLGGGRLAPRLVQTGHRAGGLLEILSGIKSGDRVVTSGNFLIAAESRLKAGIQQ